MKSFNGSSTLLLLSFLTISFVSCKKDKDEPKPECRIITVTPTTGTDNFNISYNSEGKMSQMISGNSITSFAYSGNTVIATTMDAGVFSSKKIITNSSNGLALNVRTEYDMSGTSWNNDAIEYSGSEFIKSTSTSNSGSPYITTGTWSDGNLVLLTSGASITTIDYYMDKPAMEGDYLHLIQLVGGFEIYRSKNLIKSVMSGSSITSFDYTFDADGKILTITTSGASTIGYNYQYQCN